MKRSIIALTFAALMAAGCNKVADTVTFGYGMCVVDHYLSHIRTGKF